MKWFVLAALLVSNVAVADERASCNYLEIAATTGKAPGIDPELQPLEKKLRKPPFASWNTFHKLSGGPVALDKLKAETLKLGQGAASILLRDRTDKRLELHHLHRRCRRQTRARQQTERGGRGLGRVGPQRQG